MYNVLNADTYIYIIYSIISCILLFLSFKVYILSKKVYDLHEAHARELFDLSLQHNDDIARHVQQSRNVLKGKLSEELFPLLAECPYLPADMKFFGSPVDYLILNGYSEAKDNGGDFTEIIFADIKTGNARLSPHQRKIKRAVQEGRVRWETIRMRDDGSVVFERD